MRHKVIDKVRIPANMSKNAPLLPTSLKLKNARLGYLSRFGGVAYATACRAVLPGCNSQSRLHSSFPVKFSYRFDLVDVVNRE